MPLAVAPEDAPSWLIPSVEVSHGVASGGFADSGLQAATGRKASVTCMHPSASSDGFET